MSANNAPESTGNHSQAPLTQRFAAVSLGPASHSDPINILIVDDEPKNLTVLETVLQDPGYRLVRAESGEQALLALVEEEFALLILDIRMPGMTGFELAHMIKQRKKTAGVPIIFLTAYYNEDQHVLEGYGTGAVDYLQKPVNPTILRSKVAIFAELYRKTREYGIINRVLFAEVTERRRAEDQLRELNDTLESRVVERTDALLRTTLALDEAGKRYRSLFDDSLDAIFSLGVDQRFEAANPAALRLTDRTLEELKTVRFLDLCAPDQREALENAFRAVFRRENVTLDTTFVAPTGERRDLFISATPAIVDGEVVGVSCIARDITERKRAQEAVQQSEARLSGILSSAMDAIITIDQTERITDFNSAAEQMFGCAAGEAVGQPIDRFIPKRSWTMHGRHAEASGLTDVTNASSGVLGTIYGRHTNGEEFPIEAAISESRIRAEKYYTVILRDMSERVEQETALRLSEARYRELIQAIPAAIYTCDALGRVTLYNEAAVELWGIEPTIDKTQWCGSWKISKPDGAPLPLDQCPMAVTLREGRAVRGEEIVIERPDGTRRHVLPYPQPMLDAGGAVVGAVDMLADITDRKRAESDLRKSEERLRLAQQAGQIGTFEWNMTTGVYTWTKEMEAIYGLEPGSFPGTQDAWERLVHPDDLPETMRRMRHAIDSGEPGEAEFRVLWPDGSLHWVAGRWRVFNDEAARPLQLAGVNIEITARKQSEAALRESEARFRAIADAAPVLIWIADVGRQCTYFNKGWLDFTGRTAEQELGNGWVEGVHSEDFDLCLKTYVNAFDKREPFELEYRLRRFDGQYRWILDHGIPRLGPDGTFLGYIGTCIDISELKQAKHAAQESKERLSGIISSAMDAIVTIDEMQRVTDFNNAAELMFGCAAAEALGQPIDYFIPERFRARHAHHIRAFGDTQVTKRQMGALGTIYGRRADGNEFPIEASISQLRTHAGKFYTVILRDVTERVRHEEALRERDRILTAVNDALKKQAVALAQANKELEGFSYSVSHDLRAPLRTIDAFSRILEEDHAINLDAEASRCLAIVRKAAGQAGELIDDLLEFSRLGRQDVSFHVVKMTGLAREAADELMLTQNGRQIGLIVGDLPPCQGDLRLLKLVWHNLLSNAFKYTNRKNECRIEVGWMRDDANPEAVTYYVKDDGVGFDMKYSHKLFGVFQRLHRKEEFEGTGVGLANVQRIVQRHGGRVWAEGKVNGGATFYFSLRKARA